MGSEGLCGQASVVVKCQTSENVQGDLKAGFVSGRGRERGWRGEGVEVGDGVWGGGGCGESPGNHRNWGY